MKENSFDKIPFVDILHNEKVFLHDFIQRNLSRTVEMFSYENMPAEIPIFVYERALQQNGWLCVFKFEEKLYALPCAIEGELDAYYQPKKVRVVNPYLNIKKGGFDETFTIGEDCAIVKSDSGMQGLLPVFTKYGEMARTAELTLDTLTFLARIPFLITAKDMNAKDGAAAFLQKVKNGDYGVIAGNDFFESVKTDVTPKGERQIADVVEMANYVHSRLFNEVGILADYNGMKKERTGGADTQFATPSLIPFVENMLNERKQGWERVNALFGTNVQVEFNSVWELNDAFLNDATDAYLSDGVTPDVDKIDEKTEENEDVEKGTDAQAQSDSGANDGKEPEKPEEQKEPEKEEEVKDDEKADD